MKEKHIFAGNNTSQGFFSYFDHLLKAEEAEHIYILKGGPGVGKNSFMKKFAEKMLEKGYMAEYIHCSSDNVSLDGVLIPDLKILFLDGTAPHIIDPVIPGAVDEIINLGEFLNGQKLKKHKAALIQINKAKSNIYKSAYRYLKAAGIIYDEILAIYDAYVDVDKFDEMCEEVTGKLFSSSYGEKRGRVRKLFTEAFTAKGYISHTDLFFEDNEVWAVVGKDTSYSSELLKRILNEAGRRCFDAEAYYRPLSPEKLQHLYLPEKKLIIITADHHMNHEYDEIFNIHAIMDTEGIKTRVSEIEKNLHIYDLLIKNALDKLAETKKLHDLLEAFYVNCMDFEGVDKCFEKVFSGLAQVEGHTGT